MTVLAGWVFGDLFKTLYFFFQAGNSWQFKATYIDFQHACNSSDFDLADFVFIPNIVHVSN